MASFQKPIQQSINKKTAQDLYSKYMVLALEMRATGDRALFEDYYQRAEYYLHLMNELSNIGSRASVDEKITPTRYNGISPQGGFSGPTGKAFRSKAM